MGTVDLDALLPFVSKPSRYVSGEWNSVRKPHAGRVRVALCYPDVNEIGLANLGIEILYHLMNRRDDVACERVYVPWVDLEARLRARGWPALSHESRTPVGEFDVIGFTLQHELCNTNLLTLLDLGGVGLTVADRLEMGRGRVRQPLIIAGGPSVSNAEPMADYLDAAVLGDGEEALGEIVDLVKRAGPSGLTTEREPLLRELANIPGVYVPWLYEPEMSGRVAPRAAGVPDRIARRYVNVETSFYPTAPIVPFTQAVHDRLSLEIMRGCTRGCRFCQAGMLTRPLRERSVERLLRIADEALRNTGYEEVSLSSLSSSDYFEIESLVDRVVARCAPEKIAVALPSQRGDMFTVTLANRVRQVKRNTLTFALEAGTARLREVVNKGLSEAHLFRSLTAAYQAGWRQVKFYFMIGLPTETPEDLAGIVDMVRRIRTQFPGLKPVLTVSAFVPKPHTPFQWHAQDGTAMLREKFAWLKANVPAHIRTGGEEMSFVEGCWSRGDRRLGRVLRKAWELGCRFDAWDEQFSLPRWQQAFEMTGVNPGEYTGGRGADESFPWEHLDFGVTRGFLWKEWEKAIGLGHETSDCRGDVCHGCGTQKACKDQGWGMFAKMRGLAPGATGTGRPAVAVVGADLQVGPPLDVDRRGVQSRPLPPSSGMAAPPVACRLRVRYAKRPPVRFLSHLEVIAVLRRAVRRAGWPVAYSEGFSPKSRMSFGPSLPVGTVSECEYVDVDLTAERSAADARRALAAQMPVGFAVLDVVRLALSSISIEAAARRAEYRFRLPLRLSPDEMDDAIAEFSAAPHCRVARMRKRGPSEVDMTPLVERLERTGHEVRLVLRLGTSGHVRPELAAQRVFSLTEEEMKTLEVRRMYLELSTHSPSPPPQAGERDGVRGSFEPVAAS